MTPRAPGRRQQQLEHARARLVQIELHIARGVTCVCYHPHGECLTCGCPLLAVASYRAELVAAREATRALAAALVWVADDMRCTQWVHWWIDCAECGTLHDLCQPCTTSSASRPRVVAAIMPAE